ncbi:MAG: efflux RND transporter periplasmic adaptor subunit [Verrucomicrobiaceae bacterium]|nr:efflux RND transporter periplasmic adaptor subunit [Verrucomicrobiaceae bacterium]
MKPSLLIACALALTACGKHEPAAGSSLTLPAATVKVAPATKRTLPLNEEITGTVRAKTRAVIEAKISGRVLAMNATLGQTVKTGDVLATLDAQEMQARAESAKAMLDQATSDERRTASLVATNAVSKSDYDAAKARLEVAKASVSEAQTMLGYAKVTAPFDGVITRKLADQGDLAAPGKPLLDLENPAQLRIEADIPEALIANLKSGATLNVSSKVKATVAEISPTGDPNSRTFPVKLDLPAGTDMRPGQFVRIAVPVREYEALVIPAAALVQRGQLQMVFVNENNIAKLRLIRTGRERSEGIEVLAGLDGGESLVIEGAAKLMDGQPLTVTP